MTLNLFEEPCPAGGPPTTRGDVPLAEKLRPKSIEEVLGQKHLVGKGGPLRHVLESGELGSMVYWGPPGTGKTTLAHLVAQSADLEFQSFSAVLTGIKDVRLAMQKAKQLRQTTGRGTLVFIDEIHRFNKAQQDAFLPFVERGDITLIGATTENPSFEIIGALLSRLTVHILQPLEETDLLALLNRALSDVDFGMGAKKITASEDQLKALARFASGDARRALVALEATCRSLDVGMELQDEMLSAVLEGRALLYDKHGEKHYDLISALHKSIRSSDPDAALYWLVRMLKSGEDPNYLGRRLVRMATEDIGLADPNALKVTMAAWQAHKALGSPEGDLALAEAAVYLAVAPKSNAVYQGFNKVASLIDKGFAYEVPKHLRNASTKLMKEAGWSKGQKYAHSEPGAITEMTCLPDDLVGTAFYEPTGFGLEQRIKIRMNEVRAEIRRRRAAKD